MSSWTEQMTAEIGSVTCRSCGSQLAEPFETHRYVVPHAQSVGRVLGMIRPTLSAHAILSGRRRLARGGKATLRFKVGDELWREMDRLVYRELYADRQKDRYHERVVDPQTGQTIHECHEPLSQHQGHGSASKKSSEYGLRVIWEPSMPQATSCRNSIKLARPKALSAGASEDTHSTDPGRTARNSCEGGGGSA